MPQSPTFRPGGKGAFMLAATENGPMLWSDLMAARGVESRRERSAMHYAATALRSAGLLRRLGREGYEITAAGREALADLRGGVGVVTEAAVPSVRVFADAAVRP
jgi:hypothetical protein